MELRATTAQPPASLQFRCSEIGRVYAGVVFTSGSGLVGGTREPNNGVEPMAVCGVRTNGRRVRVEEGARTMECWTSGGWWCDVLSRVRWCVVFAGRAVGGMEARVKWSCG